MIRCLFSIFGCLLYNLLVLLDLGWVGPWGICRVIGLGLEESQAGQHFRVPFPRHLETATEKH
jgi:hypothetical protein